MEIYMIKFTFLKRKQWMFFVIVNTLFLTACATCPAPKEVKIPVPVASPNPQIPPKPLLPIAKLKPNSSPDTVIKAYAASVELLQGYSQQLVTILRGYQQQ